MDLTFTAYARRRMRRRGIPEVAVYHVVEDYDRCINRDDGRTEYVGTWQGRLLLVVTASEDEPLTVINAIDKTRSGA
ncbi:MAG: DUF4258 domain-containing protein [Chloroflexi bacterium]|nr:DUF4258 domain-containing protein [Chloroflexota bacterium]